MQRKNPGTSSLPNAPLDLTPLLDVIFIFLFVVMIGYAFKVQEAEKKAENELNRKTAELQNEVQNLNVQLTAQKAQIADQQAAISAYEDRIEAYDGGVVGERVKVVTVSCRWSEEDVTIRQIRMLTPDEKYEPIRITAETQENGYNRLEQNLEEYIRANDASVVILSLNTEQILVRDQETINQMLTELIKKYDYVF